MLFILYNIERIELPNKELILFTDILTYLDQSQVSEISYLQVRGFYLNYSLQENNFWDLKLTC